MLHVFPFLGGVHPHPDHAGAGGIRVDGECYLAHARLQVAYADGVMTADACRCGGLPFRQGKWQYAHADQVGAVDAFKAAGQHGAHTQQAGALGGPVP